MKVVKAIFKRKNKWTLCKNEVSEKIVIGVDIMGNFGVGELELNKSPRWFDYYDTPYLLYDQHGEICLENVVAWKPMECGDVDALLKEYKKGDIDVWHTMKLDKA